MKALAFDIYLMEPVLVAQVGSGEENSAIANYFIPGSSIRGLLANRYLQQHGISDPAMDSTCKRMFFNADVRYLNAYPVHRLGKRMLPRPLSWFVAKDDVENKNAEIFDFAIEGRTLDDPKPVPGEFCIWFEEGDENMAELLTPERHVSVHNASENRNIKSKGQSTVYRYETIAAGQRFQVVILANTENDLEVLKHLIPEQARLGGSQSSGYGLVQFEKIRIENNWQEYVAGDELDDVTIVTLLSDVILRDDAGQPTPDFDAVVGQILGKQVKHNKAYQRMRVVGGFNRKWGLPLVQNMALQAGSVFVYPAAQLASDELRQLEAQGIGERRFEGFGRIAVNWHTQSILKRREIQKEMDRHHAINLSSESLHLAQQMANRLLRDLLDQKLVQSVNRLEIRNKPANAQLSRLRIVVQNAWRRGEKELIISHLKGLKKTARDQFEQASIRIDGREGKRLLDWVGDGVKKETIWDFLSLDVREIPSVAGITSQITDELRLEYIARLLDALLRKTIRLSSEGGKEE